MPTVSKRELNHQTAIVLDLVTESEDVLVTERGTPRWRVSAIRESDSALTRLEREGRYTPPMSEPTPWPASPGGPAYTSTEVDALIDDLHGAH